jgi:molecular chaperone GrpE
MSDEKEEEIKKDEIPADDSEVVEFEFNDDGEEDLKKTLKKLRADLKEAKKEKEEYLTGWQKERAGFVNYRKEEADRAVNFKNIVQEGILTDFISVLDSFDMAFSNKEAWEKVDKNWRQGVEYIHQQILKVLADYGVVPISANVGDKFDPMIHQSIETIDTEDKDKDHTVASIIQAGYKIGDRVLRAARVNVFGLK